MKVKCKQIINFLEINFIKEKKIIICLFTEGSLIWGISNHSHMNHK